MTNKKQKAASSLGYRVGISRPKNSQHCANMGDKLASKINAKQSLAFFY